MLTNDAICTSPDIRLCSDEHISVKSIEDNETYWFSKRGLPWGLRENRSLLKNRNYDPESYVSLLRTPLHEITSTGGIEQRFR